MTDNKLLFLLKTRGAFTAEQVAKELKITKEGARQKLLKLIEQDLVKAISESKGVGRPKQYYVLTALGHQQFPDTHAELTAQLLKTIEQVLGENALNAIINARGTAADLKYSKQLQQAHSLEDKLDQLAKIRTEEGYMAEWSKEDRNYLFVENHCPICIAASQCQGFCQTKINTFRNVLGSTVSIERIEHILLGARRCAYRITPQPSS
ncbi:metalloregulator ArsR/SmtB family transcription factor [Rapidithrix thailandica]|uniref:Metalloregulator ArsR/SmtB family transcription factor n=1 Tax=Rapidithrix thailandica TaxID=413964 RepID=A0AAW9SB72_9BACT